MREMLFDSILSQVMKIMGKIRKLGENWSTHCFLGF
jgi:hypothetical protein